MKKQLLEVNAWLIQDKKNGKRRSGLAIFCLALMWIVIFGIFGGIFYKLADSMCAPLCGAAGLGWYYFGVMSLIALFLGLFGSVFSTYTSLYRAKDNDFLLSMPIPPYKILLVRLMSVWMWSFIYEAVVFIPTLIVYWKTVSPSVTVIGSGIVVLFFLSLLVLAFTCIMGWLVAKISTKVGGNKTFITVFAYLLFFGAYYYVYFQAQQLMQTILANAVIWGDKIRGAALPLYWLGKAPEGDIQSLLLTMALITAVLLVVCFVMARSFLKMATAGAGTATKSKKVQRANARSLSGTLLYKEWKRFSNCSVYMLNCGLGTIMIPIVGIAIVIKRELVLSTLAQMGAGPNMVALLACASLCGFAAMNDISAPSVSLEGKNLWILQSLPVKPWEVLKAKLKLHMVMTWIPLAVSIICMLVAFRPTVTYAIFIVVLPLVYVVFLAALGLTLNLKAPNLKWTNEVVPVKQSMAVLFSMLGGTVVGFAIFLIYLVVEDSIALELYLALWLLALIVATAVLLRWLKTKGTRIFANL